MNTQSKPALHQFADDLCAAIKSPEFEVKTFHEVVAECLEPLIDWRAADYHGALSATQEELAERHGPRLAAGCLRKAMESPEREEGDNHGIQTRNETCH